MVRGMPTKVIGGCLALGAFAVAIVAGLAADNPADEILSRALIAMAVCYPVGVIIGVVAERAVDEHVRTHIKKNPLGGAPEDGSGAETGAGPDGSGDARLGDRAIAA